MPETVQIFEPYLGAPVTSQCFKELALKIQQYSQSEREALFASFQPKELHLQLLKLTAARISGCHLPLLDGLKEECKFVSEFSLKSKLLYDGSNPELFNPTFLIPLLQSVSASNRDRILWRLGKYVSTGCNSRVSVGDMDTLYSAVLKVWGSNIASPLLCQTSKELLERELPNFTSLSTGHLLIIAKKFPFLALSFLEQNKSTAHPIKTARYIVNKTIPKSFDYIVEQGSCFLTKSMMKNILKNYSDVVLASPTAWSHVLKVSAVKKNLTPEHYELFLAKQFLELKDMDVPCELLMYLKLLSPTEVSSILNKVFPEKYGCALRSKLTFWERNEDLLKLLDANDRSFIAVELNAKNPQSGQWLPLATTDISIPQIKKLLDTEQVAHKRTVLASQLIETALINKDQTVIEDVCKFVVNRYRNEKATLQLLFYSDLNFSLLSKETFDLMFAVANKFYDPDDWQTHGAAKLFPIAIKRNWGEAGLKEFLDHLMKDTPNCFISELDNLETDLRHIYVDFLFTTSNIENKDKLEKLAVFLPLITKWNAKSPASLISDNVKLYVSKLSKSDDKNDWSAANEFVSANLKSLDLEFVEDCFQNAPDPRVMAHLLSRKSLVVSSDKVLKKITKHILEFGVKNFIALLKKLKQVGYTEILHALAVECKEALADTNQNKVQIYTNAVILLVLTSHVDDFFSTIDPLLPSITQVDANEMVGDSTETGKYRPLEATKQGDAICNGFGRAISHVGVPALVVQRLQKFCVNGDLMLFVRGALYSVCCSLPNDKAKALLLSLMKQPVSVKKHALRLLSRTVCNIETQKDLLLKFMETEQHLTMRIILVSTAMASLNVCRDILMWQVVKAMINKLSTDDAAIVKEIIGGRLPDQFLEEYYHILLEKCKMLQDTDTAPLIYTLGNKVLNSVSVMSEKFVEHFIVELFLSKLFFKDVHSHSSISKLVVLYLQGASGTILPTNQCLQIDEPRKSIEGRQQFLKDRLDANAIDGPYDIFDSAQGFYPIRSLLNTFIERFCESSLDVKSKITYSYQLTEYVDFLLAYFGQFNYNSVLSFYTMLTSTKILKVNALESAFAIGEKFGEMCDSTFQNHSDTLFCYPDAMANFFNLLVMPSALLTSSQLLDILRGMLATVGLPPACGTRNSPERLRNTLRVMTVAHILPSDWILNDYYKEFRQTFMVLIKNTPAEVYLLNYKGEQWQF